MNRLIILLLLFISMGITARANNKNLTLNPAKPEAGKKVSYTYNLAGTPLAGKTVRAELMEQDEWERSTNDIPVIQNGNMVTGSFLVKEKTDFVMLAFFAPGEKKEEVLDVLPIQLYTGGGSIAAHTNAYMAYYLLGYFSENDPTMKKDTARVLEYLDAEMTAYPANRVKYMVDYLTLKAGSENDQQTIARLDAFLANEKDIPGYALQMSQRLYEKLNNAAGKAKAAAMYQELYQRKVSPETQAMMKKMEAEEDPQKLFDMANADYADLLKKDPKTARFPTYYYRQVLIKSGENGNWKLFNIAADKMLATKNYAEIVTVAAACNEMAWRFSGESLDGKAKNLDMGLDLSKRSLTLLNEIIKNPDPKYKPEHIALGRYTKGLQRSYAAFADTYALLLYKKGKYAEALKYQEIAVADDDQDPDANERLIAYVAKVKGKAAAWQRAEAVVKAGAANEKVNSIYKEYYINKYGVAAWNAYAAEKEKAAKEKLMEEWKAKMVNYAAFKFSLKDREGKEVSLESLAGKIVVVDFWATWCGPCRASFPGMQIAQNRYKNDPNVKFVFIDTREAETAAEADKKVNEYITKTKYPFHVLMDYDNKVVTGYEVIGIPAKFIIDKEGNVRFKLEGFSGTDQKVVDEVTTMIEILKGA